MKVQFIPMNDFCGYYRCHLPGKYLIRSGVEVKIDVKLDSNDLSKEDIVVFQRVVDSRVNAIQDELKKLNIHNVYEIDDNLQSMPGSVMFFRKYNRGKTSQIIEGGVRNAEKITVATQELAEVYSRFNDNIFVLPNYIDGELYREIEKPKNDNDKVVIGWAGTETHEPDLAIIKALVRKICYDYKSKVEIWFMGYIPDWAKKMHFDKPDIIKPIKWIDDLDEYRSKLAQIDIALAPMANNSFNCCKSDLRFLENAGCGTPVIASKGVCYDTIQDGVTGYLATDILNTWKYPLYDLIESKDLREKIGSQAREWVFKNRLMEDNVHLWIDAYKAPIIEKKEEDIIWKRKKA